MTEDELLKLYHNTEIFEFEYKGMRRRGVAADYSRQYVPDEIEAEIRLMKGGGSLYVDIADVTII